MKEHVITQSYELTISVNVFTPDEWDKDEVEEYFRDFPVNVIVNALDEEFDDTVVVAELCVDGLVPQNVWVDEHLG